MSVSKMVALFGVLFLTACGNNQTAQTATQPATDQATNEPKQLTIATEAAYPPLIILPQKVLWVLILM